jgi:hypothetical protein
MRPLYRTIAEKLKTSSRPAPAADRSACGAYERDDATAAALEGEEDLL